MNSRRAAVSCSGWSSAISVQLVLDLQQPSLRQQFGEPSPVGPGHHPVLGRPDDQGGLVERPQPLGGFEQFRLPHAQVVAPEVRADGLVGEQRAEPAIHDLVGDGPFGECSEADGESAHRLDRERTGEEGNTSRHPAGPPDQLARDARRVVVEGFAGGQDQPGEPFGVSRGDALGPAAVVLHQGHVPQVQPVEELHDEFGHRVGGERDVGAHRDAVGAVRQGRREHPVAGAQAGDHLAPDGGVVDESVEQDDDGSGAAGVLVADGACGELDIGHVRTVRRRRRSPPPCARPRGGWRRSPPWPGSRVRPTRARCGPVRRSGSGSRRCRWRTR